MKNRRSLFLVSLLILSLCSKLFLFEAPQPLVRFPNSLYTRGSGNLTTQPRTCFSNEFACLDGSKCIPRSWVCDGLPHCDDYSDEFHSQCNNCAADDLFLCKYNGVNICLNAKYQCDGLWHCEGVADELLSLCGVNGKCPADRFQCRYFGLDTCLSKERHQCNGEPSCDDGSDEAASICDH